MTKAEFLRVLQSQLKNVDPEERREILYDYEEHIRVAVEEGATETDAVADLGDPWSIGRELLATVYVHHAEAATSVRNVFRAVFAVVGLGFFNLVIVMGPVIALFGTVIGLYAASVGLILSPLVELIGLALGFSTLGGLSPTLAAFGLLFIEGVGWVLFAGAVATTRGFRDLGLRYAKFNLRLVKGGR